MKYKTIDLVITKKGDTYHANGGSKWTIYTGSGSSLEEAIGSWFRQNRERVNFKFSYIEGDEFKSSTVFGVARSKEQLGPNELKTLEEFERKRNDT